MHPTHSDDRHTGQQPLSTNPQASAGRTGPADGDRTAETASPRTPPPFTDPVRRAIEQNAGSRAFFHRLTRWFIPRADAGNLVEKLVLLFSRVAVAVSTIGLLAGGWISMERYQARMADRAAADAAARALEQEPGNLQPAQAKEKAGSASGDPRNTGPTNGTSGR